MFGCAKPSPKKEGGPCREDHVVYVGVDVAKAKHAIAIAEGGRGGEVRYLGEVEATLAAVERFVRKLERKYPRLHFCYEAGPMGYGLYRLIIDLITAGQLSVRKHSNPAMVQFGHTQNEPSVSIRVKLVRDFA